MKITYHPSGVWDYVAGAEVYDFSTRARTLRLASTPANILKPQNALVVTKGSLSDVISPETEEDQPLDIRCKTLLQRSDSRVPKRVKEAPVVMPYWQRGLWLSPDGRFAVTLRPVPMIPQLW